MKQERNWIWLVPLTALLVVSAACGGKKAPTVTPPPPTTMTPPPPTEVKQPEISTHDEVERPPEPSIEELNERLQGQGLIGDVFFDFDRYNLRPDARERLARNAEFLTSDAGRNLTLTIEGHCDERGTNEYNIALGQRRATATIDYLASLGVDRSRFKTISYGEERPFCTESNEVCWQKNRRARFVVNGRRG